MTAKPRKTAVKSLARRKGRPSGSDNSGREVIVEATRKLLGEIPPSKLTRLDVARAAGVDPNLVRYYFGDMTELLSEVVQSVLGTIRSKLESSAHNPELKPADKLRQRVRILLEIFVENPHFHELFVELVLDRNQNAIKKLRHSIAQRSFSELEKLLREADCRDMDPRFVHIGLFGILEFFVTAKPLLEVLYPPDVIGSKALQEKYASFVSDLFFGRLEK